MVTLLNAVQLLRGAPLQYWFQHRKRDTAHFIDGYEQRDTPGYFSRSFYPPSKMPAEFVRHRRLWPHWKGNRRQQLLNRLWQCYTMQGEGKRAPFPAVTAGRNPSGLLEQHPYRCQTLPWHLMVKAQLHSQSAQFYACSQAQFYALFPHSAALPD